MFVCRILFLQAKASMIMATTCNTNIKIIEEGRISPSTPPTTPPLSLPLTIFDLPWLPFPPTQYLFFYKNPATTAPALLRRLKHSLSLTLHHFHPLAGRLSSAHLTYSPGDSIPFTAAESTADFTHLSADYPRPAPEFHSLLPQIQSTTLFSAQVTIFPKMGFSIGVSFSHLLGDQRTFNNFMKTWAFINSNPLESFEPVIVYDRSFIRNPVDLHKTLLQQWRNYSKAPNSGTNLSTNKVRATFLVTIQEMNNIKQWIIKKCTDKNQSQPSVLSPYVLACSFIWVCLIKAQSKQKFSENPVHFGFNAGALTRLDYSVPKGYFGNCVGFGRSSAPESELAGDDGLLVAAEAIARTINELDGDILSRAENWVSDREVFFGSDEHVMVVGSPKVNLYEMDFGSGKPTKIEEISMGEFNGCVSLCESKDLSGGIEVGLVLPKQKMDDFCCLFNNGLSELIDV